MIFSVKNYAKRERIFLIGLFFFALFIRLFFYYFFLTDNPCQRMYDSGQYHAVATALAQGNGLTNSDGSPHFYRLPGYPIFLAAVYRVVGENPHGAMMLQIIISSLIPVLIYVLFLMFFACNVRGARRAGLCASIHLGLVIFSGLLMTETFFLFFFLLFCIMFFSNNCFGWAGIFLGCASLFRSVGHYCLIVAAFVMIMQSQKVRAIVLFVAGWLSIVMPLLIKNVVLTGLLFFDTLMGPHFLNHGATRVVMMHNKISYDAAKKLVQDQYACLLKSSQKKLNEPERNKIAEKLACKTMLAHPWQSIKLCTINMLKTMFSLYSSELLMIDSAGKLPPYQHTRSCVLSLKRFLMPSVKNHWIILLIYYEILFFFVMLCSLMWYGVRAFSCRENFLKILPVILFSLLFIGLSCVCGFARLRIALEPFLLIITAQSGSDCFRYLFKRVFIQVKPAQ